MSKGEASNFFRSFLLILGIVVGSCAGLVMPWIGDSLMWVLEYLVMCLIFLLFFEIKFSKMLDLKANIKFVSVSWFINFIINPILGATLATIFMKDSDVMQLGLFIYFLAPCTDWFLGFTRAAKGDTAIGALLVPINMLTQILLYPFYIYLFTNSSVPMQIHGVVESLGMLFVLPLCCALIGRYLVARYGSKKVDKVVNFMTDEGVFLFLFVLIFVIFVSNIGTLVENAQYLPMMILAIIIFFITSFFIAEFASKFFNISHPKKVLLTFTTAARNSQLMLGITAALFPGQPLLYAAIIIGLLVEFPHLIIITQIFINKHRKQKVVNID